MVGPIHKAVSVRVNNCDRTTWLTAKREGQFEILDGQRILNDINDEVHCYFQIVDLLLIASYRFFCNSWDQEMMSFKCFCYFSLLVLQQTWRLYWSFRCTKMLRNDLLESSLFLKVVIHHELIVSCILMFFFFHLYWL